MPAAATPAAQNVAAASPVRVAIATNIPAPYRVPVYDILASQPGIALSVFYFSGREPDRQWDLPESQVDATCLRSRCLTVAGRHIHFNADVGAALRRRRPDVVITTGFNPAHLAAFAYARLHGLRHIAMTDGTVTSEAGLSALHRWVRRRVYQRSQAFIGASDGALALYRGYGVPERLLFKSPLCADNQAFLMQPPAPREYDLLFCGRLVAVKNPLFAIEVAAGVARRLGRRVSLVYAGAGELEPQLRAAAARPGIAAEVEVVFAGFLAQGELPALYASARLLLFPTSWDPWGVVANEALAAGTPVLVSPLAGSAGELVRDGWNGRVLPLDLDTWIEAAAALLADRVQCATMGQRGRASVGAYSYAQAAAGIAAAVRASLAEPERRPAGWRLPETGRPSARSWE